jgi:hypothetical protein
MQPLGRKPCKFPSKEDIHPRDGYINWWEDEMSCKENKKAERQKVKKEINDLKKSYQRK